MMNFIQELTEMHDETKYTPVAIISQDKDLDFLNQRRLQMLDEFDEKRKEMIKEFEEKLDAERQKAWGSIEDYLLQHYNVPKDSQIKISDGVVFWAEKP